MKYALAMMLFFADGSSLPAETTVDGSGGKTCVDVVQQVARELGTSSIEFICVLEQEA